jgi:hypothetical protein
LQTPALPDCFITALPLSPLRRRRNGASDGRNRRKTERSESFPPARRLRSEGNPPQAGQERGALFLLSLFGQAKRGRRLAGRDPPVLIRYRVPRAQFRAPGIKSENLTLTPPVPAGGRLTFFARPIESKQRKDVTSAAAITKTVARGSILNQPVPRNRICRAL